MKMYVPCQETHLAIACKTDKIVTFKSRNSCHIPRTLEPYQKIMAHYQTTANLPHQHEKKGYKDIYLCKTHQQDREKCKAGLQQSGIEKDIYNQPHRERCGC